MNTNTIRIQKLVLAALCLALCMVLPFLTGQIPEIGNMLCPMHIPVLLCGFLVGPFWGAVVGLIAPLLRFALFGMPKLFPTGIAMCAELAVYGAVSGLLYARLPRRTVNLYVSPARFQLDKEGDGRPPFQSMMPYFLLLEIWYVKYRMYLHQKELEESQAENAAPKAK